VVSLLQFLCVRRFMY